MRVVANHSSGRSGERGLADIEAAGGPAMALPADVRGAAAIESMVVQVQAAWGDIDVPVHNAPIPYAGMSFQDMTWEGLGGKIQLPHMEGTHG
jgi:3-oxoacyl-[acyl-carrier protein] reductase